MNVKTKNCKPLKNTLFTKAFASKAAVLSLSLIIGACAATGDKVEKPATEPKVATVDKKIEKQDAAPEPTAAELMKTLKAPLVEPPEATVEPKKVVKEKTAPAVEVAKKKVVAEAVKKQEEIVPQPIIEKTVAAPVVEKAKQVEKPVEATQPDLAQQVEGISAKPFNVSASKLPFNYDVWTIKQGNTPLTKGLVIATPTWEMGKEGYTSQIWLTMMEDKIHVNSSSDIETASKGLGIRIDGGELIKFSSIADDSIGVISGQWLDKLAAANKIDIYLGFFPGKKPTSETFSSDLSLKNLARMVATYRMLNQ